MCSLHLRFECIRILASAIFGHEIRGVIVASPTTVSAKFKCTNAWVRYTNYPTQRCHPQSNLKTAGALIVHHEWAAYSAACQQKNVMSSVALPPPSMHRRARLHKAHMTTDSARRHRETCMTLATYKL